MATKDLSYFVKREHKNSDKVNKRLANKSKEIEKILKQQEKVILDRIDKFYQDFGDTYGVSEEQAKKLVSQFDVDTFKERARKYVETKDTSYTANYDMRLYDTKQRISRLKLLLNEINLDIAEGYQKTSLVMNDILTTNQMKELERQANLFKLPKNQVKTATEALLRETYKGAQFSSYWGKDLTNLYDILDTAIKGAVFNGQHPFQLKGRINKEFKTKDKWSKRLLITETTRMQSMVQIAAMKEAGYEYFRFIAEKSACDECGSYNNKVYSLEDWERLTMVPPVHPHCRCSLVPATKEEYLAEMGNNSNVSDSIMNDDFLKKQQEQLESFDSKVDEAYERVVKARGEYDRLGTQEAADNYNAQANKYNKLRTDKLSFERDYVKNNADRVLDILSKQREFGTSNIDMKGHVTNPRAQMSKVLTEAYSYYPTDWIKRSMDFGSITTKKVTRGYYRHGETAELALSSRAGVKNSLRTAIHELGHRQEFINADILRLEKEFYDRRTSGEKLVRMKDATGILGYANSEVTRVDNFLSPYMGKEYPGNKAYEVLTMAVETLFAEPMKLAKDKDMFDWIIDLLLNK